MVTHVDSGHSRRQAMRVGVVFAKALLTLRGESRGPRLYREFSGFEIRGDVLKVPHIIGLVDPREVRLAVGRFWSRRGEVRLAVRRARNAGGRVAQPLRERRRAKRAEEDHPECRAGWYPAADWQSAWARARRIDKPG